MYGPVGLNTSQAASPQTPVSTDGFDFGLTGLADAFRVPRLLNMRIIEAKLPGLQNNYEDHRHQFGHEKKDVELFFEVIIDGDIRARTMPRVKSSNAIWMEQFEFNELPSQLNAIELVLKQRTVKHKRDRGPTSSNGSLTAYTQLTGDSIGVVTINLNDLEYDTESEVWWPIYPISRNAEVMIGEVMLKLRKEELVVLMMEEYKPLLELLQNFHNGLTIQIGQVVSSDLRRLAHTLLKIFQVSGKAVEWLMALTEAEIDGLYKENTIVKYNFPIPGVSTDMDLQLSLLEQPENAPKLDGAKRALMEANILFRGNSLLTKAVEAHMKRFGKEYMDETVGEHVKRIAEEDIYCEVDPMKCKSSDDLRHNWKMLNSLVRTVWQSIYVSAGKCPPEVKRVLYHVRMCVEEKYGNVLEGVSYSSVSGFLFLRFFCPAVLNPKLFGILKDHPGTHAQRTLTLIAKSLQGLANMTTFGVKEPWFEPMNEFLVDHTTEFRQFIDSISAAPPAPYQSIQVPPSYATPITIQARLPQASKEGFPSLPFLIDQPRAIGRLVQKWLKWHEHQESRGIVNLSGDLLRFHEMCLHLKDRMTTCVERAENAERPGSSLSNRWEAVAESVASSPAGWESRESIGIGYSTTPTPSIHKGYASTSGGERIERVGYSRTTTTVEEEMEYAGMAAIGKSKLSDFVGGLKRKVKAGREEWKEEREREKERDREGR
ncbi:Neurofibromin [Dactylella cylindrospora]|nr:Neurofibromin [Dactylella cylindrospora]